MYSLGLIGLLGHNSWLNFLPFYDAYGLLDYASSFPA